MIFRSGCICLGLAIFLGVLKLEILALGLGVLGATLVLASICILISRFMP